MKYIKLFENFEDYDPYELMMVPAYAKNRMIWNEVFSREPNLKLIQDLITLGADLDLQDEDYMHNSTILHTVLLRGQTEIARMLIEARADVNIKDKFGSVPLHNAATNGHEEITQMLIDVGANLDVQDNLGWTPLHMATFKYNVKIVQMLIDAGARIDIENKDGKLPYDLAKTQEMKNILKP